MKRLAIIAVLLLTGCREKPPSTSILSRIAPSWNAEISLRSQFRCSGPCQEMQPVGTVKVWVPYSTLDTSASAWCLQCAEREAEHRKAQRNASITVADSTAFTDAQGLPVTNRHNTIEEMDAPLDWTNATNGIVLIATTNDVFDGGLLSWVEEDIAKWGTNAFLVYDGGMSYTLHPGSTLTNHTHCPTCGQGLPTGSPPYDDDVVWTEFYFFAKMGTVRNECRPYFEAGTKLGWALADYGATTNDVRVIIQAVRENKADIIIDWLDKHWHP